MISASVWLFGLANSSITRDRTLLVISECVGAVWDVESMGHP
jgi:hypothetical protein